MATLRELSGGYREAAVRLRLGLEAAERQLEHLDGAERRAMAREIHLLRQMLREMRDLRQLAEGYYTRPRSRKYTTAGLVAPRVDGEKQ